MDNEMYTVLNLIRLWGEWDIQYYSNTIIFCVDILKILQRELIKMYFKMITMIYLIQIYRDCAKL